MKKYLDDLVKTILILLVPAALCLPPIQVGIRKVFFFDFLCFFLFFLLAWRFWNHNSLRKISIVSFLLTMAFWWNGYYRDVGYAIFQITDVVNVQESIQFQPFRELIVAIRLLSCIGLFFLVPLFFQFYKNDSETEKFKENLQRIVQASIWFSVLLGFLSMFSNTSRIWIGKIYGYNPDSLDWSLRLFGSFQSPVEAGATIGFFMYAYWLQVKLLKRYDFLFFFLCSLAVLLSKSATTMVAISSALIINFFIDYEKIRPKFGKKTNATIFVLFIFVIAIVFAASKYDTSILLSKLSNFFHRERVWSIYQNLLFEDAHHFLTGLGFWPMHSDSFFIFILSRSGILGFLFFLGAMNYWIATNKKWIRRSPISVSYGERYLPNFGLLVFCFIVSLTSDFWIFRPVVAIVLGYFLPIFSLWDQKHVGMVAPQERVID